MPERIRDHLGAALKLAAQRADGFVRSWVRREPGRPALVRWGVRVGPLAVAMVVAAVMGFSIGSAQSGAGDPQTHLAPPRAKPVAAKTAPPRALQIQVRADPPVRVAAETVPPAPPLAPQTVAPQAPLVPLRIVARAAPPPIPPAPRAAPEPQPADEDPDVAAAERELAGAYRDAAQAGVSAQALRADRQAWRMARDAAAGRSRRALLNAYRDQIEDLRDLSDEAAANRQQAYAQGPYGYPPGYGPAYPRY